jgi:hypothetical protein
MFIIEFIFWMIKFAILSIIQPFQSLIILLGKNSYEDKRQAIIAGLYSLPFLIGIYLIIVTYYIVGIILIIASMFLGAMIIKKDGTF